MSQLLHYHRCDDCLTAFSSTEKKVDYCDCMGTVTYMGEVHGDKYVKHGMKSACDGRCTHASGPVCDCMCGGINHGTGKMVATVIHEGKVKAVGLTPDDIERAEKWRMVRDYANKMFGDLHQAFQDKLKANIWVDRTLYFKIVSGKRELNKILDMKKYNERMQKMVNFIGEYSKVSLNDQKEGNE